MPIFLIIIFLSFTLSGLAQTAAPAKPAPPNFTGTWRLNAEKSDGLQGVMHDAEIFLIVKQTDKQLTADQKIRFREQDQPSQSLTYSLDGKETTAEVSRPAPGTMQLQAAWVDKGKTLELHAKMQVTINNEEITFSTKEYWVLLEDGKELKLDRTRETPQGTQVSKLIFELQPPKQ